MKFLAVRAALEEYEKKHPARSVQTILAMDCHHPPEPKPETDPRGPPPWPLEKKQTLVGGVVKFVPIDRTASIVVSKAPWWAKAPTLSRIESSLTPKPKRKKHHHMKSSDAGMAFTSDKVEGDYVTQHGLKFNMIRGQPMVALEEVQDLVCRQIQDHLHKETNPQVKAAQDARQIINELLDGIGADMAQFRANTKAYLEEIRQTRFAIVTETAQMTKSLTEVRQFFLGSDYKEERARLIEFVDLCERLAKLKESGFLDKIADTMLALSINQNQS